MAAPPEEESLEAQLNKATNPLNRELEWDSIKAFCDQLNKELEGPQLATRFLAHKIQSPQEWEAIQALTVLETCMKNCGKRFHNEVGKFRFLNELIKVVSPKYLGTRAPEKVKNKVLELMFSWTVGLPDEQKITEAYSMLKKQGIIKQDPVLPHEEPLPPPPPRAKNAMFEDEEKSKLLARLLKSSHPEDLRAANKLIKEMVQEDQKRMEKISKRVNAIEEVNNNVKLLSEMLENYSKDETSESNEEIMKELYQRCEKMRPTLFRLASDTEDNDEALAEILQANDNLTQVINMYKKIVKGEEINGVTELPNIKASRSALLDLCGLDTGSSAPSYPAAPANQSWNAELSQDLSSSVSLLDDELMSLGLNDLVPNTISSSQALESSSWNTFQSSEPDELSGPVTSLEASTMSSELLKPAGVTASHQNPTPTRVPASAGSKALDDLDMLGKTLLQQSLPPESQQVKWSAPQQRQTLRDLQNKAGANSATALGTTPLLPASTKSISPILTKPIPPTGLIPQPDQPLAFAYGSSISPASAGASSIGQPGAQPSAQGGLKSSSLSQQEISLTNVLVPLESIKPSSILPVTVYDKNSFRVLFHFAKDPPPGQPDVLVVVTSMISTAPQTVKNIRFQAAVPKVMKVKLQPPSGTELPAFNPIVPPSAITQVLLLANPQKEKVRLRYKLTFTLGDQTFNEMGDVDQFPPPESWGSL
ncbi:ADP-ribosylation factor-binding protein GGA1 [Pristis pectinata]|uniref:ADP-ribosylation factor-binding protein GGA1 n=1 Tax=Pristis pectinata TaxID=685728 RepID=UPI00223D0003|nr:ADP-ribosylation factor-binding protein GGA1 [Pristis pectinata]